MNCVTVGVGEIERSHSSYQLLMKHEGTTVLSHFLLLLEGDLWVVLILKDLKQRFSKKKLPSRKRLCGFVPHPQ
jgi:hypothetical protein